MAIESTISVENRFEYDINLFYNLRGELDASSSPDFPAAIKSDAYYIKKTGSIGGKEVETGNIIIAKKDTPAGDDKTVGNNWHLFKPTKGKTNIINRSVDIKDFITPLPPTFPSAKIGAATINPDGSIDFGKPSSVPDKEGRAYYDPKDMGLNLSTDIPGSRQTLGQEFWIRVINKTGSSIPDGSLVYISGFDSTSGRTTIALGKADAEATSNVVGFITNAMANNTEGFVTAMGFLNDLDTSSFSAGDEVFLSDTVAGGVTLTKPLNAVPVGFITKVDASTGQILTTIARKIVDSPLFSQLSDSTNQKPTTTSPTVITFDTNDDIRGITHSITLATEDIIIVIKGTYTIFPQPQVERTSGASPQTFHMWLRIGDDDKGGVTAVSVANPSEITTDVAHGLTTGQTVEITNVGTTPDINAQHVITVTSSTTYTIPVNVTAFSDEDGNWRRILDVNDDLANSNVELRISGVNDADVIPLKVTKDLEVGKKINVMQSVSITTNGVGLVVLAPAGEPRIPSIILTINKD